MIVILIVLALCAVFFTLISAFGERPVAGDERSAAWERAMADEASAVGRILLNVSRPASRVPKIYNQAQSPQWRALQRKLLGSNSFGGDVEVFLSVQVICLFLGAMILVVTFGTAQGLFANLLGLLAACALAAWPYTTVKDRHDKRMSAVAYNLPDFAELLQMPLRTGLSIRQSLEFTAERIDGPVSEEVRNMEATIRNNPMEEAAAFVIAGERLGTPEAIAFFSSLLQAHLHGAKVIEAIVGQAEQLRIAAYHRQRAEVKKLPVRLVTIFGLHLMPLLFVAALMPTLVSLGGAA